ncbi:RES domain-containing protein [Rhodococcus hoagii]|nr:RES domain-containing protein [Prescottella equi]
MAWTQGRQRSVVGSRRRGGGRFDLVEPRGTCYVAFDERTAIRETVGEVLATAGIISREFADERVLSPLRIPPADPGRHLRRGGRGLRTHPRIVHRHSVHDPAAVGCRARAIVRRPALPVPVHHRHGRERGRAVRRCGRAEAWAVDDAPEPFAAAARRCGFAVGSVPRTVRIVQPPG